MDAVALTLRAAVAVGAKAYGGCDDCSPPGVMLLAGRPVEYEGRGEFSYAWNPLDDDGQAFRLMVSLHIDSRVAQLFYVEAEGDPCAAMRRAVVSAAAALSP